MYFGVRLGGQTTVDIRGPLLYRRERLGNGVCCDVVGRTWPSVEEVCKNFGSNSRAIETAGKSGKEPRLWHSS
jgi:hypothetical protein